VDGVFDDEEAEFGWEAHEGVRWWWGGHCMGFGLCLCVCVLRALWWSGSELFSLSRSVVTVVAEDLALRSLSWIWGLCGQRETDQWATGVFEVVAGEAKVNDRCRPPRC
jgi:hypothetical protein